MNVLAEILSSRTRAELFRLLFGTGHDRLHLREVGRRTGLSIGAIRQEAIKLQKMEIILCQKDGNRSYYEANRNHPLYEDIHRLVLKTVGLADVLRAALQAGGIACAFVFGSVVKGTAGAESDIDLMVIGDIGLRKIASCLSGLPERLGREINPHVLSPAEWSRRKRRNEHFISSVMALPKLFIIGSEYELETMAG